jgi:hypothetical protein
MELLCAVRQLQGVDFVYSLQFLQFLQFLHCNSPIFVSWYASLQQHLCSLGH